MRQNMQRIDTAQFVVCQLGRDLDQAVQVLVDVCHIDLPPGIALGQQIFQQLLIVLQPLVHQHDFTADGGVVNRRCQY